MNQKVQGCWWGLARIAACVCHFLFRAEWFSTAGMCHSLLSIHVLVGIWAFPTSWILCMVPP